MCVWTASWVTLDLPDLVFLVVAPESIVIGRERSAIVFVLRPLLYDYYRG